MSKEADLFKLYHVEIDFEMVGVGESTHIINAVKVEQVIQRLISRLYKAQTGRISIHIGFSSIGQHVLEAYWLRIQPVNGIWSQFQPGVSW